jgi:hypothetical protein
LWCCWSFVSISRWIPFIAGTSVELLCLLWLGLLWHKSGYLSWLVFVVVLLAVYECCMDGVLRFHCRIVPLLFLLLCALDAISLLSCLCIDSSLLVVLYSLIW